MSGVSQIIVDPSLFGEVIPEFPAFPTQNKAVFNFVTAGANFTVPSGVTWIGAKIWGAGGSKAGDCNEGNQQAIGGNGAAGSYAQVLIEVTPAEILQVRVGGSTGAFYNGPRNGSSNDSNTFYTINGGAPGAEGVTLFEQGNFVISNGGSGGGYSGIFINPANPRPLAMIGGGGGGGQAQLQFSGVFFNRIDGQPSFRRANINSYFDIQYRGQPRNNNTAGGGGGGGATGGRNGNYFGSQQAGEGGNPTALFRDIAIQTNLQLTNPTITPRKIQLIVSHPDGSSYTSQDPDFVSAGNNFCLGGFPSSPQGRPGLVILYWNNS